MFDVTNLGKATFRIASYIRTNAKIDTLVATKEEWWQAPRGTSKLLALK